MSQEVISSLGEVERQKNPMYNRIFPLIEVAIGRLKGEGVNIDRSIIDIHVLPIMIELIQNPEIQKNHELQEAIYRHIVDFIDRVGSLSAIQIGAYTDRRKYISDLKFSEALNTTKNRHAYIMNEIIREGANATLIPQLRLIERSYRVRYGSHDRESYAEINHTLSEIDILLPDKRSLSTWLIERSSKGNISNDHTLYKDIGLYLIDILQPKGASWLREMLKNGYLTEYSQKKGFTDVTIGNRKIDIVGLLMDIRKSIGDFQGREVTLNSIRSGIKKDKNYILPEESEYFSDIAPRRYDIRTLEMMVENTKTKEDFERVLAKIAEDYTVGFIGVGEVIGIAENGKILRPHERATEIGINAIKLVLAGKIITKLISTGWILSKGCGKLAYAAIKKIVPSNHPYIARLRLSTQ